jgi:hypothetical protein
MTVLLIFATSFGAHRGIITAQAPIRYQVITSYPSTAVGHSAVASPPAPPRPGGWSPAGISFQHHGPYAFIPIKVSSSSRDDAFSRKTPWSLLVVVQELGFFTPR